MAGRIQEKLPKTQRGKSVLTAVAVVAALVLWFLSGSVQRLFEAEDVAQRITPDNRVSVRVRVVEGQPHTRTVTLRGTLLSLRKVMLKAEVEGQVTNIGAEKGSRIAQDTIICQIAVRDRAAKLAEAKAYLQQRELEVKAARSLVEKGHRSPTQAAAAEAAYDAARAQVELAQVELENTRIRAPYDGVVDDRPVEVGTYMQIGDVCATFVDDSKFLLVGYADEQDVQRLKKGMAATAALLDGRELAGSLRFVSSVANESTRTFKVELVIDNPNRDLREGMTADLRIPLGEAIAHQISPAFLVLNDDGALGVRTLDKGVVRFRKVTLLDDGPEGVWLEGLQPTETIITVGHQFVRDGQKVRAEREDQAARDSRT